MQVWVVLIAPAGEVPQLSPIAVLGLLRAGAGALLQESLQEELVLPQHGAGLGGIEEAADVLELCRERWKDFKRTTRKDVIEQCDGFKTKDGNNDRKALRTLRSLEGKGLLESKAETTEITFKPIE